MVYLQIYSLSLNKLFNLLHDHIIIKIKINLLHD